MLFSKPYHVNLADCTGHRFNRFDSYLFFAEDVIRPKPVMIEIGSFSGVHSRKLYEHYGSTIIVYEAGRENYKSLRSALGDLPVITRNQAVTGQNGEVTFYEFKNGPSANSTYRRWYERFRYRGYGLKQRYVVPAVSLEQVFIDNSIDHIDVLFSNCEGGELGMIEEIIAKPTVWARMTQFCVSFHPHIYGRRRMNAMLREMSKVAEIVYDAESRWPCHLLINRNASARNPA